MASNTRPFLMTGAALASAAAVVVATPAIVPNITTSPLISSSAANYNLTTFSDVFTIPSSEWIGALFQGYGGLVGPNNPTPSNPEETGGLEPWASSCDGQCFAFNLPAVGYLALDALINGNGEGWDDNENWSISAVNYFFEGGPAAGTQWLAQSSIGAANPLLGVLVTLFFTGPQIVTVIYDNALSLLADAALGLPLVGQYIYGAINAYLGPASQDPDYQGYFSGLSGVFNYFVDVVSGNAPAPPAQSAALAAAVAAPAARSAGDAAPAPVTEVASAAVAAVEAVTETVAVDVPAAGEEAAQAPAPSALESEAAVESEAVESEPAAPVVAEAPAESAPVSAADAVADAVPAAGVEQAPAAPANPRGSANTGKRPVRDAVAKVTASIASALGGAKAATEAGSDAGTATASDAEAGAESGN